ncbi:MAG: ABC transporter ATP-binding protein [Leptospiraceae bacterium]|nr:ABC transporter ATP-binding protein [Leptospiraceae bacterium]MCP5495561.1 ABC transporter ATP-binding protein [Leptospiraceae bacterium]
MIQVTNLTKYYGKKLAIQNLSFELKKGEIVGLLGLNGSGKTTTIRILSGYLVPSEGFSFIDGINIFQNPIQAKQKVGYLPENPPLYEDLSVYDYLEFVSRIKGINLGSIQEEIGRVCEKTNLMDEQNTIVSHLSLGYRKRVGIAQALLGNPSVIIMDEPISGLDPKQIIEMRNLIKSLSGSHTLLISSHILSEISRTCDRFLFLHQGKLCYENNLKELKTEMKKLSLLEITISGKDKETIESYLKNYSTDAEIKFFEEDLHGYTFTVKVGDENSFKDKIVSSLPLEGLHLEALKKQEVTLEQIFMSKL